MRHHVLFPLVLLLVAVALPVTAEESKPDTTLSSDRIAPLSWRSIGPSCMGGRITALAVVESAPATWYVATASGGLLKTTDDGISFTHQFDRQSTVSIGDVAVDPTNPDVVWVGTGEANPRNSVSWGDGVYKSTDGGTTWARVGLERSFQIGAIAIDPRNPDVVYVGALGRLWGPNEERGLYKTTDGGATWEKLLHVDDDTGVVDIAMHPGDPDTLLVATWERRRDGFDGNDPAKKWGPGTALWKSTDAGRTFRKITAGLPTRPLGRIGIAWARSAPDVAYIVLETDWLGCEPLKAPYMGINGQDAEVGAKLTQVVKSSPAERAGLKVGDIVLVLGGDKVHSYAEFIRLVRKYEAGDTVSVEVSRDRMTVKLDLTFGERRRPRGAKGPTRDRSMFAAGLGGQRANLQDQQGSDGHQFGGVYRSGDRGESWTRVNTLNPRPMYFSEIRVDPTNADRVHVLGIRYWVSEDGGKAFKTAPAAGVHVDHHALWIDPADSRHMILGNDGGIYATRNRGARWDHLNHVAIGQFYHVGAGPRRDYRVYGGLQDNGSWGGPSRSRHGSGPTNADWIRLGGGDGFVCRVDPDDPDNLYYTMQYGGMARWNLRTGERGGLRPRAPRGTRYRWNWNTPYVLSNHNGRIVYAAGNHVFRSLDRGRKMRPISPEITRTKRGTATAFAESQRDPDVLWVGTDDGALWRTRDGGHTWIDVFAKPAEAPVAKATGAKEGPSKAPAADGNRGARLIENLMSNDANGDGKLQAEELPESARRFLDRADTDEDGALTAAELRAMMNRPRSDRRAPPAEAAPAAKEGRPIKKGCPLTDLVPDRRWVAWIEISRFVDGRVYLVLDGHRSDDDRPHLYVSDDHGATWRTLRSNLPDGAGTTRVLREDLVNRNLLYLGTEFGAWASIDAGKTWTGLNTNLPTVAVHGFAIHPTAGEVVVATHGRSLWILDVTVLRQLTGEALAAPVKLFRPKTAVHWRSDPSRGRARSFVGTNPTSGGAIWFSLAKKAESIALRIEAPDGKLVRTLEAKGEPGLQRVVWDLRHDRRQGRRARRGPRAKPGVYRAVLTVDGATHTETVTVEMDPDFPDPFWMTFQDEEEEREAAYREEKRLRRNPHLERGED